MTNLSTEQKARKVAEALSQIRSETCGQTFEAQRCRLAITDFLAHSGVDTRARLYDLLVAFETRGEALANIAA